MLVSKQVHVLRNFCKMRFTEKNVKRITSLKLIALYPLLT